MLHKNSITMVRSKLGSKVEGTSKVSVEDEMMRCRRERKIIIIIPRKVLKYRISCMR